MIPHWRITAQASLEQDGHTVVVAENGDEACRLFIDRVPDLVLLDVVMPVLSGYEVCTRLRGSPRGAHTPVLMLTGSDDEEAVAHAYDVGATDFHTKPVNWRVLRERVNYMLKAQRDADGLLTQLAHYDSLTGLPNRVTFRDQLERGLLLAEERGGLLAVLFLDLDGFKEINDTFGHGFGDQILKLAADRLTRDLRADDTVGQPWRSSATLLAGRFGGDEFTVCATNLPDAEAAKAVADRIRRALASPFQVEGHEVFVTASTGVSVYPFDGTDADTLLKHADAAMYDAKADGRNNHAPYRPSLSVRASEKLFLAGELRGAVDRGEFRVHYQPKVEIQTGRVVAGQRHSSDGSIQRGTCSRRQSSLGSRRRSDWVRRSVIGSCGRRCRPASDRANVAIAFFRLP